MWGLYFLATLILLSGVSLSNQSRFENYKDHTCIRKCDVSAPMTCKYDFTVEYYYTLTRACYNCPYNVTDCYRPHCVPADGVPRAVLVVNRMLPGPAIHVCEKDTVIVNVHNKLEGAEGISIHWHGILQKETPHMDGVSMLTQCPIPAHSSFQYRFRANDAGTHFWHSHSGIQRSDGIFGAFVVRQADQNEAHLGLYDFDLPEHTIIVNDWMLNLTINKFAAHHHAGGDNKPASMLVNGKGVYQVFRKENETYQTPHEVISVDVGRRYRLRFINNGILHCPIQVSIDNHTLKAIASDGQPFKPVDVESFNIFAGERYDIVLLTDQPVANYWIRVRGQADCGVKKANQVAILRYTGANDTKLSQSIRYEDGDRQGKKLNPLNQKGTELLIPVSQLETLVKEDNALKETPDKKFYLAMDFNAINNYHFHDPDLYPVSTIITSKGTLLSPQINHITSALPPAPPLTQFRDIPQEMFCNTNNVKKNCSEEFCTCAHHLQVDLGDTVELVVIDEGKPFDANHPMHLHGYGFRVIGMDRLAKSTTLEEVMALDKAGNLTRNLTAPVVKDTVTIPDGGYSILRFYANNPGFWFLHCHIEFHAEIGMGLFIQVGNLNQFPKTPKNFPRCGDWHFTGYEEEKPVTDSAPTLNTTSFQILLLTLLFLVILN